MEYHKRAFWGPRCLLDIYIKDFPLSTPYHMTMFADDGSLVYLKEILVHWSQTLINDYFSNCQTSKIWII